MDYTRQLIRVNDQKDTRGHSTGTTCTYEYDNGGNITYRRKYAYTEGTLPDEPLETTAYTYDADWKDKLTRYTVTDSNNNITETTIGSDNIGNITGDGTWSYTWQAGRRLSGMSKIGTTISYLYDENGQRIKKSVTENGITTDTFYTVAGKSVTHVRKGTDNLHIFYANGKPSHCSYNGTMYSYVYSLQGDVLGLKNSAGTLVVTYLYDAWGKEISRGGTLAGTLGAVNPFRYRGYVFDEESGLYYVSSRYYNNVLCRWINADDTSNIGIEGSLTSFNLFVYCGNNPVSGYDPNGSWNWGGVLAGLAIAAAGMAALAVTIATCGAAAPAAASLVSAAVTTSMAITASTAVAVTGATMTYAAATDSTMVLDVSFSSNVKIPLYYKGGVSVLIDFGEKGGIYAYAHNGGGCGWSNGISYSVGLVSNFEKPDDYSEHFVDLNYCNFIGLDHCYNPYNNYDYLAATKATSISFSHGLSYGAGWDYYSNPWTLATW